MSFDQIDPASQTHVDPQDVEEGAVEDPRMDDTEIQSIAGRLIHDAVSYSDSELGPVRKQATDYYKGRGFGDEEEGRSQIVITTVRDTILAMMPSVMRTFFGPSLIGEFAATSQEMIPQAELATRVVDHIIKVENKGWRIIHAAVKDAMLNKRGVVKYWWDDAVRIEQHDMQDLTEDQLLMLEADPDVEYVVSGQTEFLDPMVLIQSQQAVDAYEQQLFATPEDQRALFQQENPQPEIAQPTVLYDVEIKHLRTGGCIRLMEVPPEEFLYSSDGSSIEDAIAVIHRRDQTRSQLAAMGVSDTILEGNFAAKSTAVQSTHRLTELKANEEAIARQPGENLQTSDAYSPENQEVPLYEVYTYMDIDGDGIAEHVKLVLVGRNPELAFEPEVQPDRPFAIFEVDPEPHTMEGNSIFDRVSDLQLVESKIMRGTLDSLAFALHPRTAVVEGQVNIGDVLNTEIGAVIRERAPGMVREFPSQFAGAQALPILEYFKVTKEERVGVSRAAAGLDPDSLQSSTKAAVAATVSGAQQHLDLLVRMLAETGLKQLMVGILKLLIKNQTHSREVRLNGKFTKFDPRHWDAMMDFNLTVGVGMTMQEQRLANLRALKADQLEALQLYGPTGNPVVTVGQYSQTLQKIAELTGAPDASVHFKELEWDFDIQQPPPKPSPEEILANSEAERVKGELALKQADQEVQHKIALNKDAREEARVETELFLKAKDIELKYNAKNIEAQAKEIAARAQMKKATEQPTSTGE